jgi:hypothetical protein
MTTFFAAFALVAARCLEFDEAEFAGEEFAVEEFNFPAAGADGGGMVAAGALAPGWSYSASSVSGNQNPR